MHQTKKGNDWHFGLKAHIGVDARTGITHSFTTTAMSEAEFVEKFRRLASASFDEQRIQERIDSIKGLHTAGSCKPLLNLLMQR